MTPREIRLRLGWTQRQMAEHHGCGQAAIRNWERYGVPSTRRHAYTLLEASIREPETLGGRLRQVRTLLGWSGEDMAHALDLSPATVYRYECGERTPPEDVLHCYRLLEGPA